MSSRRRTRSPSHYFYLGGICGHGTAAEVEACVDEPEDKEDACDGADDDSCDGARLGAIGLITVCLRDRNDILAPYETRELSQALESRVWDRYRGERTREFEESGAQG